LFLVYLVGVSTGSIIITAEEVQDSKFTVSMTLSAYKLDKKDFFGKVISIIILNLYNYNVFLYSLTHSLKFTKHKKMENSL